MKTLEEYLEALKKYSFNPEATEYIYLQIVEYFKCYYHEGATKGKIDYYEDCAEQLQQENEAMKQLIEWIEECDFGFDNFVNDYEEDINMTEEEFDKETENMSYIESMIHYAKLYIKTKGE